MNNNKKWIAMGAGLGIGAVMLTVSGLSAMAGTSGYDAWKSAVKQTHTATSFAAQAGVVVSDGGTKLIEAQTAFKKDGAAASGDVRVSAGGASHGMNVYVQDGKTILKPGDSDVYRIVEHGKGEGGGHGPKNGAAHAPDPELAQKLERVFDALVGNLKDRVTLDENADGSKRVALSLSGNQVPVAVNAIGSLLIGHAGGEHGERGGAHGWAKGHGRGNDGSDPGAGPLFAPDTMPNLPKLTQDVRIDEIKLNATIDANNYVDDQSAEIQISGKDDSGAAHTVVIAAKLDLSGVNATKADSVDLTGKTVEPIEPKKGERGGR
ncbi:hypothetical protein [Paenibacillus sp. GYB003]|uniref:hypothetical protein n=1 Tax=Paenibacillus sp. GYB003 TaxID=2994392 RepID=UPI002F96A689